MCLRDPLPDYPTVEQLRLWAEMNSTTLRQEFMPHGVSASDLVWPVHCDPGVQRARAGWENRRPFPSDEEILLLMLLFAPQDEESELDDHGWNLVGSTIIVMSAADPIPAMMCVDLRARRMILPYRPHFQQVS